MINNDADAPCPLAPNASSLEFREGEATALTDFTVVTDSLATDGRAQELERADTERGGLCLASSPAAQLASRLVDPGADAALPVLPEVVAVEDCKGLRWGQTTQRRTHRCCVQNPLLTERW